MADHKPSSEPGSSQYDVVIVGAGLAGSATAIQLLSERPELKVLILDKDERLKRRVGEATVEVSAFFLIRKLGLGDHLAEHHFIKQGLRFWFANEGTERLADCSEIGARYQVRLPSFLIDRAVLDEEALRRAESLGAEVRRPVKVRRIELNSGGLQTVHGGQDGDECRWAARWVVDASGFTCLLARQEDWWESNPAHPTTAVWSRWRGVKSWDDPKLSAMNPRWQSGVHCQRNTATNHLVGDGWWAWWIPLKGGDVSIGAVCDRRLMQVPEGSSPVERLRRLLTQTHPAARELLSEAEPVAGDSHWRSQLPYRSRTVAGDGFALVGDAAGFIDPFYSPGLDWMSYTTACASHLVIQERSGKQFLEEVNRVNRALGLSYHRWFEALYRDKYYYLGEYDLLKVAFLLDLGLYYLGVVTQPYLRGGKAFQEPIFSTPPSVPFYHFMKLYNRRLASMGWSRRERGVLGRRNQGHRFIFGGYSFSPFSILHIMRGVLGWIRLEVTEGWRTWLGSGRPAGTSLREDSKASPDWNPAAQHEA